MTELQANVSCCGGQTRCGSAPTKSLPSSFISWPAFVVVPDDKVVDSGTSSLFQELQSISKIYTNPPIISNLSFNSGGLSDGFNERGAWKKLSPLTFLLIIVCTDLSKKKVDCRWLFKWAVLNQDLGSRNTWVPPKGGLGELCLCTPRWNPKDHRPFSS